MAPTKIISGISIFVVGILIALYFVPTNEFFGISSYNEESPSPMMILGNDYDEILSGFEITPVSCSVSDNGLNESHFQIANMHDKGYGVKLLVSFTDNDSVLYEKEVDVVLLAKQTINQTHQSDDTYDNPICVVQISDWYEV